MQFEAYARQPLHLHGIYHLQSLRGQQHFAGLVRIALDPRALAEADFATFAPVLYFRGVFAAGWSSILAAIAAERSAMNALPPVS